jgi:ABC-2 type transport system permease protein
VKLVNKITERYRYSVILLRQLVITDFKLRYKNSALGYVWSMLRPLLLFLVLYIVFIKFLKIKSNVNDPAIYLLMGIVIWSFFTEVTTRSIDSVVSRGDILRKINFPKYIIVFSVTISALINLFLNGVVIFIFTLFGHTHPIPIAILAVPLLIIELLLFALGIGFLLSAIYVKLRDVNYIWEVVLQAGFYATPILYPVTIIAAMSLTAAKVMLLSPVAQVIQDIRYCLVDQSTMTTSSIFAGGYYKFTPLLISIVVFVIGALVFRKNSKYFAEDI